MGNKRKRVPYKRTADAKPEMFEEDHYIYMYLSLLPIHTYQSFADISATTEWLPCTKHFYRLFQFLFITTQ
jgi:hypothetical protein